MSNESNNCNHSFCWAFDCSENCKHIIMKESKVKNAEEIIQDVKTQYPTVGAKTGVELCMRRFSEQENELLQSRITEFDTKSLEYFDDLYKQSFRLKDLEAENKELREALQKISSRFTDQPELAVIFAIAEQALKLK